MTYISEENRRTSKGGKGVVELRIYKAPFKIEVRLYTAGMNMQNTDVSG